MQVPENRRNTSGHAIHLRVALLPAHAAQPAHDAVVFLAGGPGQAATEAYPAVAPALELLRRTRDVVLVDQRGTGGSHPLACSDSAVDVTPSLPPSGQPRSQAGVESDAEQARAAETRLCLQQVSEHSDPTAYTTTESAADLESVRQAMGIKVFDVVGVSYGTRLAQQFARSYPAAVRAMVLDSAVPNDARLDADIALNLDKALAARWDACADLPACAHRFPDPFGALRNLDAALRRAPRAVHFRDPQTGLKQQDMLTADALEDAVRLAAYAPETAAVIAFWVDQATHGDAQGLMAMQRMGEADVATVANNVLQLSVLCSEDPPSPSVSTQERATLLGARPHEALQTQCAVWPRGFVPAGFHDQFQSDLPTLVLQGEWDPATPPDYGRRVMAGLSHGQLLLARGQGHNVLTRGCIPRVVADFLDAPLHPVRRDCVARMGPLPDVLSPWGATP